MPLIETVPEGRAKGAAAELYARARENYGYIPNMFRAFSLRPDYMDAWSDLLGAIRARMEPRRYELVTLAAALTLRSSYCALSHGAVLLRDHIDEETLTAVVTDFRTAGLDPAEVAAMEFAIRVVTDAASIDAEDHEALRRHGFRDEEICDIAAAAAARCFFSKFLDGLGAAPDPVHCGMSPALRDLLTVGRDIDDRKTTAAA